MQATVLDPLDLAALLCSRICHDIINPVGAIMNGLESPRRTALASTSSSSIVTATVES